MKHRLNQRVTLIAVLSAAAITGAHATSAALINGDFQTDNITGVDSTIVPAGWSHTESGAGTDANVSALRDNGPLTDATRDQFYYMNQDPAGNSALLFQDTGIVIVEGLTYTLTADVGEQGNQHDDDLGRIGLYGSTLGTGTAFAELTDIDPDADDSTSGTTEGEWGTFQSSFTATASQAGQTLGVYLGFGDGTGENGNLNVSYDNVSVAVVPEPGSLALTGLGGLLVLRRRRNA